MAACWDATQAAAMVDLLTPPPKTRHTSRITVRLSADTAKQLEEIAAAHGCKPAELARHAVQEVLAEVSGSDHQLVVA